jgi:hypothetical protein
MFLPALHPWQLADIPCYQPSLCKTFN